VRALDPRLVRRTRSVRPLLIVDTALGAVTTAFVVLQATLLARIVAGAFDGAPASELRRDAVALALAFAGRGALAWGMEVAGRRAATSVLSELRLALVARRLETQPTAADGTQSGEIAAAAVQGIEALEAYFARYLPQVVLASIVPFVVVGWVATVDLESALVMAVTLPLVPVFMWLVGRATEQRTRERWHALRCLSTDFLDVVRGLPTLRSFNRGGAQATRIAEVSERHRRATMGTLRLTFLSGTVLELAATLGVALVAVTVGVRLAPEVYLPLRRLGAEYHASADGLAVADRMLALLDAPVAACEGGPRPAPSPTFAPVRLEGVAFAYPARPGRVLDGCDFELAPGETVALVGESGAGKSTVAALLLGFLQPTAGRVTVGGVDLADCQADDWHALVAWVPQHPALVRGTVADNIRIGRQASDRAVRAAAALAGADAFVCDLPGGYGTLVGDGGRPLSPGERRRIGLARAFLGDPALVVLDEPTADLDPASVEHVSRAVRRLGAGRTVLLIAHRPEMVAHADRIVRLEDGAAVALPARWAA